MLRECLVKRDITLNSWGHWGWGVIDGVKNYTLVDSVLHVPFYS